MNVGSEISEILIRRSLFCLLQILLWIDLNKSRRTEPPLVSAEPRSMFREILMDTADPIVLMLMGPFLKLTRSVLRNGEGRV